jgi:hypothetical protein
MRILFDQGTPVPLRRLLVGDSVSTAFEMGWSGLGNGALAAAEGSFDILVTNDKNLRYQQDLTSRNLAILVLPTTSWPTIRTHTPQVIASIEALQPGEYVELSFS